MNISVIGTGCVGLVTGGRHSRLPTLRAPAPDQCTAAPEALLWRSAMHHRPLVAGNTLVYCCQTHWNEVGQRIFQLATRAMHPSPGTAD